MLGATTCHQLQLLCQSELGAAAHSPSLRSVQVLHVAEFLHNRPKDPLCAKALQRRAVARKVGLSRLKGLELPDGDRCRQN